MVFEKNEGFLAVGEEGLGIVFVGIGNEIFEFFFPGLHFFEGFCEFMFVFSESVFESTEDCIFVFSEFYVVFVEVF